MISHWQVWNSLHNAVYMKDLGKITLRVRLAFSYDSLTYNIAKSNCIILTRSSLHECLSSIEASRLQVRSDNWSVQKEKITKMLYFVQTPFDSRNLTANVIQLMTQQFELYVA